MNKCLFRLLVSITILSGLPRPGRAAITYVSDTISTDQTWSDSVYLTGNLIIKDGIVTVEPGTYIYGSYDFKIKGPGVLYAKGTATNRIRFRSLKLIYEALTRDSLNLLQYCRHENKYCLLEFRNPSGVTEQSYLKIDHCEFYGNGGYTCLYITSGGNTDISYCSFHNAGSGVFVHGGDDVRITYTDIYHVGCGIIHGTMAEWYEDVWVDHCVIYDVDSTMSSYDWAWGNGIACLNDPPGYLNVSNTVFSNCDKYGIWDQNYDWSYPPFDMDIDYNCYYMCEMGPTDGNFDIGANSIEVNPNFTNPGSADFSLQAGSPCLGTANDGTHRGSWQGNTAPRIVSRPITDAYEDSSYSYDVEAEDVDTADGLVFSLTAAPGGMGINASTGVIAWVPVNADVGVETVTVKVTDDSGAYHTQTFELTVINTNDAPVITPIPDTSIYEDVLFQYPVPGTDVDIGDTLTYSLVTSPDSMTINSSSGQISWTPRNADVGVETVTLKAADGHGGEDTDDFVITVINVDDPPTVANPIPDVNVNEDALDTRIILTSVFTDIDNDDSLITKSVVVNTNPSLVTATIVADTLTLDYQPEQSGISTIAVRGTSNGKVANDIFYVTVAAVDDPPEVANPISNIVVDEDAGNTNINLTNVFTDIDNIDSLITKAVFSNSDTALVAATIVADTLTLDYQADRNGPATLVIRGTSGGKTVNDTFQVTVNPVDDGPTVANPIANVVVNEDAADTKIALGAVFTDIDNDDAAITKTVLSNSNPALVSTSIGSDTLTLDYQANQNGSAALVIRGTSNGKTVNDTFLVTVNPVDDPPTVANPLPNVVADEDDSDDLINLSNVFTDIDNDDASITKAVQSNSNMTLVSASIVGNTLTLDYQADQTGTAGIVVRATSGGKTVDDTFQVTVNAVDDPPAVANPIADVVADEDDSDDHIILTTVFTDIDNDDASITKAVQSNTNPSLISASIAGDTLTLDYQADCNGSATIVVRGTSNAKTADDTVLVTVNAVDDAPHVANPVADVAVDEDAPDTKIILTNVFSDIDNDDASITKAVLSNSDLTLVSASIVADTLTLDFLPEQSGTSVIIIRGTSNGKTVNDTFQVTVNLVDDPPVVANPIGDVTADEDDGDLVIGLGSVFTDVDNDDASIAKAVQSNSNAGLVSAAIVGNALTLDYQADRNGSATIVVRGTSGGKTVDDTFQVTVNAVDDGPVVANPLSDVAVDEDAADTKISLSSVFTDIDNDDASIIKSVQANTNPPLVSASIAGDTLTLDYQNNMNGSATIVIRGTSNGKTVDDTFQVTVNVVDDPPVVANPIGDVTADEDDGDLVIGLGSVFTDVDNDDASITKAVQSNSNAGLVSAAIVGNALTLDYQADQNGSAAIVVRGTSNGKTVDDTFQVTVNAVDDGPVVANPLSDVAVDEDAPDTKISLSSVFTDIDNDDAAITKTVQSNTNPSLVSASIVADTLTLDYQNDQYGSATITIRGTSGGKTVDDTFTVTVNAVNDAPQITSAGVDTAQENAAYSYAAIAADPDNTPSFLFQDYPGWLSPSGNTLSGTAPFGSRGDTVFTVIASDGALTDTLIVQLAIKDSNGVVPVGLSSFTAEETAAGVTLCWSTVSEQGNLGWNVLRAAGGSTAFIQVNRTLIPGAGTTNLPQDYTYTDATAGAGSYQYQLEQVDVNGQRSYSDIITVTVKGLSVGQALWAVDHFSLTVASPARTVIRVGLNLAREEILRVSVLDAGGRPAGTLVAGKLAAGAHEFTCLSPGPGIYFIRVTGGQYSIVQKALVVD